MPPKNKRPANEAPEIAEEIEDLVFEDPFGDDYEEEEFINEDEEDDDENTGEDQDELEAKELEQIQRENNAQDDEENNEKTKVWRQGIDTLPEGEELEFDPSAYIMYHTLRAEWPCLSFDILRDSLGEGRIRFPMSMYLICGSQADRIDKNCLTIMKLTELSKTHQPAEDDESAEEDEDEDVEEDPVLEHVNIPHHGGVNRIRSMPQYPGIVATMADTKHVNIFDLTNPYHEMQLKSGPAVPTSMALKPSYVFKGHRDEGFAIDWSPVVPGRLATGDCSGIIHVWSSSVSNSGGFADWKVDSNPYKGHKGSVEDIQWSPTEGTVFSSASADNTIKIWDTRGKTGPQLSIAAHTQDVNVLSWNRNVSYLLASGSDDGSFKVWDLRTLGKQEAEPLAHFKYHKDAVTSIEWAPHDESVICVSSADNQVTVWDLSVEADQDSSQSNSNNVALDYPPQLLFIHQGQNDVKEIHFHPQIPGVIVSTAEDSINIFKPAINVS